LKVYTKASSSLSASICSKGTSAMYDKDPDDLSGTLAKLLSVYR
jgi:hypothetical protein